MYARNFVREHFRELPGQIEYWAKIGRAVELHLRAPEALRDR